MRTYRHTVNEEILRQQLAGPWSEDLREVRTALTSETTARFNLTRALDVYFEGVCFAWGFNDQNAIGQLRREISNLTNRTIEKCETGEIQLHSTYQILTQAGAGADPDTLRRYAAVLQDRDRQAVIDRDPHVYRQDLLDGLIALVLGDDAKAQAASTRVYEHLHHPRTPPAVFLDGIPHAIDAVARQDQAALDDAAEFTIELFVDQVAPTRDQPARPTSLIYPTLSLIYRTAVWRQMKPPTGLTAQATTSYVLPSGDLVAPRQAQPTPQST